MRDCLGIQVAPEGRGVAAPVAEVHAEEPGLGARAAAPAEQRRVPAAGLPGQGLAAAAEDAVLSQAAQQPLIPFGPVLLPVGLAGRRLLSRAQRQRPQVLGKDVHDDADVLVAVVAADELRVPEHDEVHLPVAHGRGRADGPRGAAALALALLLARAPVEEAADVLLVHADVPAREHAVEAGEAAVAAEGRVVVDAADDAHAVRRVHDAERVPAVGGGRVDVEHGQAGVRVLVRRAGPPEREAVAAHERADPGPERDGQLRVLRHHRLAVVAAEEAAGHPLVDVVVVLRAEVGARRRAGVAQVLPDEEDGAVVKKLPAQRPKAHGGVGAEAAAAGLALEGLDALAELLQHLRHVPELGRVREAAAVRAGAGVGRGVLQVPEGGVGLPLVLFPQLFRRTAGLLVFFFAHFRERGGRGNFLHFFLKLTSQKKMLCGCGWRPFLALVLLLK